jgi:hypothetical protein
MTKKARLHRDTRLLGKVVAFNFSPKGHIEGALVDTDEGIAQLNFMRHAESMLGHSIHAGAVLDVAVELDSEKGDHPVYRVVDEEAKITGEIVRLNYSTHGEVNGYHLDEGTFVHVKPHGARKYDLHVGQRVVVIGRKHEGPDSMVMEATAVDTLVGRAEMLEA